METIILMRTHLSTLTVTLDFGLRLRVCQKDLKFTDTKILYRCVVKLVDDGIHFCDYKNCIENRRFAVRNKNNFDCSHISKVIEVLAKNVVVSA